MIPVILSGGSGSRLWPLSRKQFPKQFLALTGEHTLFQQTLSRLVFDFAIWSRDEKTRPVLLVCEEAHRYVPNEKNADGSSVGKILSRIAKEGRKYGVSLGVITQRRDSITRTQDDLDKRQIRLEAEYQQVYQRYLGQYSRLQAMQSQMSSTLDSLNNYFAQNQ